MNLFYKLKNRSVRLSINAKLLIILFTVVIIPLFFVLIITLCSQQVMLNEQVEADIQERSSQTVDQLTTIYTQINSISNIYFLDRELNAIVSDQFPASQQIEENQRFVSNMQRRYNPMVPDIDLHVTIISNSMRVYGDGAYQNRLYLPSIKGTWWYEQLMQSPWHTLWIKDADMDRFQGARESEYIYSIRILKDLDTWENCGLLILSFLESDFVKLYMNSVPKNGSLLIFNANERMISSVDRAKIKKDLLSASIPFDYLYHTSMSISGNTYDILSRTLSQPGWQIISATPTSPYVNWAKGVLAVSVFSVFSFLLVLILFYILLRQMLVRPLMQMSNEISKIGAEASLSLRLQIKTDDEIGQLSSEFNRMLDRIEILMKDIKAEQIAKRQAELQTLYAQINPHFIYNTIASIRVLILSEETYKADKALLSFSKLLRSSISETEELCTIGHEAELCRQYIEIEQLCFDQPFRVTWELEPELQNCKMIHMTLQTLVENAIMHGLKPKAGDKQLFIQIKRAGENIAVQVEDNGIGTDEKFEFDSVSAEYSHGIGMRNVHSRIVLNFGAGYGLTFQSAVGAGTKVTMLIPKINSEEMIL